MKIIKKNSAESRLGNEKRFKGMTGREIQDEIFRKMPADKKIKLVFALSALCLKLNRLNGNYQS